MAQVHNEAFELDPNCRVAWAPVRVSAFGTQAVVEVQAAIPEVAVVFSIKLDAKKSCDKMYVTLCSELCRTALSS